MTTAANNGGDSREADDHEHDSQHNREGHEYQQGIPMMETASTTTVMTSRGTKSISARNPVTPARSGSLAVRSATERG